MALIQVIYMGLFDALNHLLNFIAPAAFLALALFLCAKIFSRNRSHASSWWAQIAINFAVGVLALTLGLFLFGRDGKMLTYTALVLACASSQWLLLRNWR